MEQTGATMETAKQEPNKETETAKSFTQAEVDAILTKALQTREKNLKGEFESKIQALDSEKEQIKLQEAGKYKELWEKAEKEKSLLRLERETNSVLSELKMLEVLPVFGFDNSTLEGRKATAEYLQKYVNEIVEKRVTERITNAAPAKSAPANPKAVKDMTPDEFKEYKKQNNIR